MGPDISKAFTHEWTKLFGLFVCRSNATKTTSLEQYIQGIVFYIHCYSLLYSNILFGLYIIYNMLFSQTFFNKHQVRNRDFCFLGGLISTEVWAKIFRSEKQFPPAAGSFYWSRQS